MGIFINKLDPIGIYKHVVIRIGKMMRRRVANFQSNPWNPGFAPPGKAHLPIRFTKWWSIIQWELQQKPPSVNPKMNIQRPLSVNLCKTQEFWQLSSALTPGPHPCFRTRKAQSRASKWTLLQRRAGRNIWHVDIDPKSRWVPWWTSNSRQMDGLPAKNIEFHCKICVLIYMFKSQWCTKSTTQLMEAGWKKKWTSAVQPATKRGTMAAMARKSIPNLTTRSMHGGPSQRPWSLLAAMNFKPEFPWRFSIANDLAGNPSDRGWSSNTLQTS